MSNEADVASAPSGARFIPATALHMHWRQDDYAWTHSAPVEGFFTVLTIVVVPFAILRWTRHLHALSQWAAWRRHRTRA